MLTRKAALKLAGGEIRVPCGRDRFQRVRVDDSMGDVIRLWSVVVTRGGAQHLTNPNPSLEVWRINSYRELVGFKVAEHGRVIGECWVPMIGITEKEWKIYVMTLAKACDRMEYLWTGKDADR
ncbi:MAG TPA: hypothetical protein VGQ12_17585 [Candidatus Angelobacter sp.]|nr:hypothetical protein [Candidatus Angelobacter sp.]